MSQTSSILGLQEVQIRVEGRSSTIFEGIVLSKGHNITTQSGGTHRKPDIFSSSNFQNALYKNEKSNANGHVS